MLGRALWLWWVMLRFWRWALPAALGAVVSSAIALSSAPAGKTFEFSLPVAGKYHHFEEGCWDAARGQLILPASFWDKEDSSGFRTPEKGLVWINLPRGAARVIRPV